MKQHDTKKFYKKITNFFILLEPIIYACFIFSIVLLAMKDLDFFLDASIPLIFIAILTFPYESLKSKKLKVRK